MKAWAQSSDYGFNLDESVYGKIVSFDGEIWVEFSQFNPEEDTLTEEKLKFLLNAIKNVKKSRRAVEESFPDMEVGD